MSMTCGKTDDMYLRLSSDSLVSDVTNKESESYIHGEIKIKNFPGAEIRTRDLSTAREMANSVTIFSIIICENVAFISPEFL